VYRRAFSRHRTQETKLLSSCSTRQSWITACSTTSSISCHEFVGVGYCPLPRRTVIQPATAEASIRVDSACNHHVICYCAMLDYEGTCRLRPQFPQEKKAAPRAFWDLKLEIQAWAKRLVGDLAGVIPV
jgi:hypothetical protein